MRFYWHFSGPGISLGLMMAILRDLNLFMGSWLYYDPFTQSWNFNWQLLFQLYFDIVYKSTYYFNTMRWIQRITGTEVHQYMVRYHIIIICVNSLRHIHHKSNGKYKWMRVDTIYDLITNVILCYIIHIRSCDICGT